MAGEITTINVGITFSTKPAVLDLQVVVTDKGTGNSTVATLDDDIYESSSTLYNAVIAFVESGTGVTITVSNTGFRTVTIEQSGYVKDVDVTLEEDSTNGIYSGSQKIASVFYGKTKIGKIYKGSTLVYASTVPDTDFLKQPDFAKAIQFNQGQSYQADVDCWLCIGSNRTGTNDPYLEICPDSSFGGNTVRVFMMTQRVGISNPCGGTMIPLKKGWWYRSINLVTVLLKIPCVVTGGKVPYKHQNGLTKMPDYTTGVSVAQNSVTQAATDIWLYSRGNTRKIEVGKTSSTFTTIAEGVYSATEEPSTLVFIEKGLYYRTTGTENRFYKCLE